MTERDLDVHLHLEGLLDASLRVESFRGTERLSELYSFEVEVIVADHGAEIESVSLGCDATLTLRTAARDPLTAAQGHGAQRLAGIVGQELAAQAVGALPTLPSLPPEVSEVLGAFAPHETRSVHGIVTEIDHCGAVLSGGERLARYRVVVSPRAYHLRLRKTSRVFQDLRVDQILEEVLAAYFIPVHFVLREPLPVRRYTTQLEETDWAFVQRLAAEVGLFFYFELPERDAPQEGALLGAVEKGMGAAQSALGQAGELGGLGGGVGASVLQQLRGGSQPREAMVFADDASAYPSLHAFGAIPWPEGPTLAMHGADFGLAHADFYALSAFARRRKLQPESVAFDGFDPRAPRRSRMQIVARQKSASPTEAVNTLREVLSGDGASSALDGATRVLRARMENHRPFERYVHESPHLFADDEHDQREAERLLNDAQREADVATGQGRCPWVSVGRWFNLSGHELERMNRKWVPTTVEHTFSREGLYCNTFACVPREVVYAAESAAPRRVQVCYTAIVTGTETIHTQESGMVEVRFHWDRENKRAARRSTCWLRVMQPWAGPAFGTQFLPRVGTEVVVTFEGGNPDKPFVLGGVHNAENPPPFPLPEERTKSGIRTKTVGGEGSNELSFEDAVGRERVYLHAERDHVVDVGEDQSTTVHRDATRHVERNDAVHVQGTSSATWVGRRSSVARGGEHSTVYGSRAVTTHGDETRTVHGNQIEQVLGDTKHAHVGRVSVAMTSDFIERIEGNAVRVVGGEGASRNDTTKVTGKIKLDASETIVLSAARGILLRCGNSVLRLDPNCITIKSTALVLDAAGRAITRLNRQGVRIHAPGAGAQIVAAQIKLKSAGAALGLTSEAALDGAQVLLNSPANATDAVETESTERTYVELVDQHGEPVADAPFRFVQDDGTEIAGTTDAQGRAVLDVEETGDVHFPGLLDLQPA